MNLSIGIARLDRLDLATILAAAACAVWLAAMSLTTGIAPAGPTPAAPPHVDREETDLRAFLGHYPPADDDRQRLGDFLAKNPGNALALFHHGLLAQRAGRVSDAAADYSRALSLRRDLADRSSPQSRDVLDRFAGEGLRVFLRERSLRPGDPAVDRAIDDLYFIRRSLAGGCD